MTAPGPGVSEFRYNWRFATHCTNEGHVGRLMCFDHRMPANAQRKIGFRDNGRGGQIMKSLVCQLSRTISSSSQKRLSDWPSSITIATAARAFLRNLSCHFRLHLFAVFGG